ncbi:adenosylcobinamide-phosphate synthase CbiB [Oceaniglobus ichthyenteri]|uniref:adenosylcobinamide-phosphate synthase CbiB n=1 Tax=Oceaniglobus ichthyenteri TaxID=2136177 RepID=UPI000D3374F6|nr:adenosylcobinamide-phosphate synthase CbiB [Oceaniglobus ichthyenteri]
MTLILALILDAIFGEPRWLWSRLPHPAVLMGRAISRLDTTLNTGRGRRAKGIIALALLIALALAIAALIAAIPLGPLPELIVAAILLAQRSLVDHVRAVADGLRRSTADGRRAVAMIVSRDTAQMNDTAVARSAIESAAENLSDGVIAPAFWFALAGLPGLLIYKITNTADSMIGYRTPRHADFGWAAARFDDLLNLIPARLTALILALTTGQMRHWAAIRADAKRHKSPNAGWPEAAMARALDIALAGPRSYEGQTTPFPYVNPTGRHSLSADDIDGAIKLLWRSWASALALLICIAFV